MSFARTLSKLTVVFAVFLVLICCFAFDTKAQQAEAITFQNPSFEDSPAAGRQPKGWANCGFPAETPPDTQNGEGYFFNVHTEPQDGQTYVGMVTRDNDTYERVGNKLSKPLIKGKIYTFSIWLCRSSEYKSQSRKTLTESDYTTPAVLKVWLGDSYCDLRDHLTTSKPIVNSDWVKYTFVFTPTITADHICFEAFYANPNEEATNGNLLLDNVSGIEEIAQATPELPIDHQVLPLDNLPDNDKLVNIWPNPVSDYVMVALEDDEVNDAWMDIYDMQGRIMARNLVKRGVINKYKIEGWVTGIYKYSIKSKSGDFIASGLIEVL
jgi:Secretion system C-terminal sorting domain